MDNKDQLKQITADFVGQKCVRATRTYGTMFILDFGKMIEPKNPEKKYSHDRYEWSLLVENCRYVILQNDTELAHQNTDEKIISEVVSRFEGRKVLKLEIDAKDGHTEIYFENGLRLSIDSFSENSAWNLQDPRGYYLSVGPGNFWEYTPGSAIPKY